jgi:hypothetical protein
VACVPGRYLIIDLEAEPPAVANTDDVLPQVILDALAAIDAKLGMIMTSMAEGQAQIQNLADGMNAVATHVTSAQTMLADWIAANQSAPLDFTPALNALASVQAAAGTLDGLVPQAPSDPIQPIPLPPDPAPDPATPVTDPATPDPSLPPGGDVGTATDPTTTPPDVPPAEPAPL